MMTRAYSELYIDEVQDNLGEMTDYLACSMGLSMEEIGDRFLASRVSGQIERGNPDYLVGKGGLGLAVLVMEQTGCPVLDARPEHVLLSPGLEYWTGWALAALQWHTGMSFASLAKKGYGFAGVSKWYNPYHEASLGRFLDDAERAMRKHSLEAQPPLRRYRTMRKLTQQQLAELSGVSIRMVRAYEQRKQDISRAEAGSVLSMSRVLRCSPADLIDLPIQ